ncbi:MAG: hypothetical protein WBA87_16665, partial [Microbacterium sp.]
ERLEAAGLDLVHLPPMSGSADPAHLAGLDAVLAFGHLAFDGRCVRRSAPCSPQARPRDASLSSKNP